MAAHASYGINLKPFWDVVKAGIAHSSPVQQDKVTRITADEGLRDLVDITPKKFTGDTKRAWIDPIGGGGNYRVINTSPVMAHLEKGTKDHGPVKAKKLYIPLRKAALVYKKGLQYGRDFVLAKRVKGIKARNYVENYVPKAMDNLVDNVKKYILDRIK